MISLLAKVCCFSRKKRKWGDAPQQADVEVVCEEQGSIAPLFFLENQEKWPMGLNKHHRSFFYVRSRRLVGESLSAFCTSSLENVSAIGSLHSLSETVLLLSLTLFGLISSEHSGTSLRFGFGSVSDSTQWTLFTVTSFIIHAKRGVCQVFFLF